MASIHVTTKKASADVKVTNGVATNLGDVIISSTINGVIFMSEDISKQIGYSGIFFNTSYKYIAHSLEVFINGMKLSPGFDYEENSESNGFNLIEVNANFQKWINSGTSIVVKYIKTS
jgi:hypothetical protein